MKDKISRAARWLWDKLRAFPRARPGLWKLCLVSLGLALLALILTGVLGAVKTAPVSQSAHLQWMGNQKELRYAQLSFFFDEDAGPDFARIYDLRDALEAALKEGSMEPSSDSARLWIDAFSVQRDISTDIGGAGSVSASVTGIGGDYFYFHPVQLMYGQLISGDDLLKDMVVIDETLAWQLFGAFNVVDFPITVGGQPCFVAGVVRKTDRWPERALYGEKGRLFASFELLEDLEPGIKASCYEIILPDPVAGYAYGLAEKASPAAEDDYLLIENSARYGTLPLLKKLRDFSQLGTQTAAIALPYWENAARMAENWALLLMALILMLLITPVVCIIFLIVTAWRRRGVFITWIKDTHRRRQMERWQRKRELERQRAQYQDENPDEDSADPEDEAEPETTDKPKEEVIL